jgi:hypothetical protein
MASSILEGLWKAEFSDGELIGSSSVNLLQDDVANIAAASKAMMADLLNVYLILFIAVFFIIPG